MEAKEYLSQAFRLDNRINSKIDQIALLNDLATKCTSRLTGMPHNPSPGNSQMADAIGKIVDLEAEINRDIDRLIDLKREIASVISRVDKHDYRTLLERRYLGFETWDKIAAAMGYSIQHVYRLRDKALAEVQVPVWKLESPCE